MNVLIKSTQKQLIEVVLAGIFVVNFEHVFNNSPEAYLRYCQTPTGIYLFKVDDENTRAICEICSKLTKKTPKFEQIFHIVLVCSLLTLGR